LFIIFHPLLNNFLSQKPIIKNQLTMATNQRRDFLKKSLMGISAAALLPATIKATTSISQTNNADEIPVRVLGKTGLKVPVLSMGTGDTQNPAFVKGAFDHGVRLFGTSAYYGNGNNESMLGGIFKTLPRESFLVATSAMPKGMNHQTGLFSDATDAPAFQSELEAGMKRLNVDYLDILFLPFAAKRESVFFEPYLRVMENFKKQGKARVIGIATHSYIDEAIKAATDTKIYDLIMTSFNFRLENIQAVTEAVTYAANAGMGMIAMKTMAGNYWDKERTKPINSSAALKWVLNNENIHTMMSGMTTIEELQSNLDMVKNLKLTDEDLKNLRLAQNSKNSLFCLQCRECEGQCPQDVDIPTLMRGYMYAYGYRNLHHARQTVDMVNNASLCDNCDSCRVDCKVGFDVKQKIQDIARLKEVPQDFLSV
jgi:predicted aldo/keto reductase-like oxidoreductase